MDSQTKRTLLATLLCMAVVFGWIEIQRRIYPPPTPTTQTSSTQPGVAPPSATDASTDTSSTSGAQTSGELQLAATSGPEPEAESVNPAAVVELGDDHQDRPDKSFVNDYRFKLVLDPRGAAIKTVTLADFRARVAKDPKNPDHDPYVLLRTIEDGPSGQQFRSFETQSIRPANESKGINLADAYWSVAEVGDDTQQSATFLLRLSRDGKPLVEIRKTYTVKPNDYIVELKYEIENLSDQPERFALTDYGPIGIERADIRYDHPRAMISVIEDDGRMMVGENVIRTDVIKQPDHRAKLLPGEDHVLWSALSNKYFTCIIDPRPQDPARQFAEFVDSVTAVARQTSDTAEQDLTLEQVYSPKKPIPAGATETLTFSLFFGPKNDEILEKAAPGRRFDLTRVADSSMCTFAAVTHMMTGLLTWLYSIFGNWGVAIIVLVIIVRLVLHPVTRSGQIHMMRMQKNMAKLKPKLEAIQQQYKNDRQKLNEETMKLYKTEGINPAGSILGCLPMFLQMPIWVALYTALNTNVVLRHAPFFGYIRDLSAPDALIDFGRDVHIPILSWMMGPVRSLNLLPIIMALVMYGQQKYMQKLTRPDKPSEPKYDKEGRLIPDQMAQQQKIMNFMMIFMGLLFYNMPSGLCLYILCSSLLGMAEQLYIRKHLKEKDVAPDSGTKPRKPGFLMRKFGELQKTVEQARTAQESRPERPRGGRRSR